MKLSENDQLLRIPTVFATRARLLQALADRHRLVVLLGEPANLVSFILHSAAGRASAAGRLVHTVPPERLRAQDLDHADRQIVVAIDGAGDLSQQSLHALDAHLRARRPTQILLAGPPAARTLTATLPALHHAPMIVTLPPFPERDARAFLKLRGRTPTPRLLRIAGGDAGALDRLAAARGLARLPELAESPVLATILDRPLATLATALAVAAFAATASGTHALGPTAARLPAPPTVVSTFQPPPIETRLPPSLPRSVIAGSPFGPSSAQAGVVVDREDPDDPLAARHVTLHRGDTIKSLYARLYRGLTPPPLSVVRALNPHARPGDRLVFPAPDEGWPSPP